MLWFVGFLLVVGGMYYVAFRIEPHWVSKDGRRFLCNVRPVTLRGASEGRARETWIIVRGDGTLQLDQKRRLGRRVSEIWTLTGKAPTPPPKRAVYLLRSHGDTVGDDLLALQLPCNSRAVKVLDDLLAPG